MMIIYINQKKLTCFIVLLLSLVVIINILFNSSVLRFTSFQCGLFPFTNGVCFTASREHNYKYLHNEPRLCDGDVDLLIMVLSTPGDFVIRQTIRETWGSFASEKSKIRLAFMLGTQESKMIDKKIKEESESDHDIIQKDFIDSYKNLTLKSESILHFSAFHCESARFILKVDSDMFINVPLLLDDLKNSNEVTSIVGFRYPFEKPHLDKSDKWYVDPSEYPLSSFPDYVGGPSYVIPGIFTKILFQMSLKTRLLPMEDVYITGVLRSRLSLPLSHNTRFQVENCHSDLDSCQIMNAISCHRLSSEEIIGLWTTFEKCYKECKDSNTCYSIK